MRHSKDDKSKELRTEVTDSVSTSVSINRSSTYNLFLLQSALKYLSSLCVCMCMMCVCVCGGLDGAVWKPFMLSCLELDKPQSREKKKKKQKTPKQWGWEKNPPRATSCRLWANAFLSSPRTPALRHSKLAGWAGLASPSQGWALDCKPSLLQPQASWVWPSALERGVGQTNGTLGFQTISRCLRGPTYFLCKVQSVWN